MNATSIYTGPGQEPYRPWGPEAARHDQTEQERRERDASIRKLLATHSRTELATRLLTAETEAAKYKRWWLDETTERRRLRKLLTQTRQAIAQGLAGSRETTTTDPKGW